jgi:hypothetical protein
MHSVDGTMSSGGAAMAGAAAAAYGSAAFGLLLRCLLFNTPNLKVSLLFKLTH